MTDQAKPLEEQVHEALLHGEERARFAAEHAESERKRRAHEEAIKLVRFGRESASFAPVATEIWAHTLDEHSVETGYIARQRGRTFGEIAADLAKAFKALEVTHPGDGYPTPFDGEGFSCSYWIEHAGKKGHDIVWPANVARVMCYANVGGSEGHYAHVDLLLRPEPHTNKPLEHLSVFTCKTFSGFADAYKIAAKFAELLGA